METISKYTTTTSVLREIRRQYRISRDLPPKTRLPINPAIKHYFQVMLGEEAKLCSIKTISRNFDYTKKRVRFYRTWLGKAQDVFIVTTNYDNTVHLTFRCDDWITRKIISEIQKHDSVA